MITTTTLPNGLIKRVSDTYMLRQTETGNLYSEAVDIPTSAYTYVESETLLPDEEIEDTEALKILTGGAE